jgi:hypothetical protein
MLVYLLTYLDMIKELINNLAYDNIKLSQSLTRAKLIASKINNTAFKTWINHELEGYENQDSSSLPEYRKFRSVLYLTISLPFGQSRTLPVSFEGTEDKKFLDMVQFHSVTEPISIIEQNIDLMTSKSVPVGQIPFLPEQVQILGRLFQNQIARYGGAAIGAFMEVGKSQYQTILELTKQKLLDTLLDLDNEFPNLNNEFIMNKENNEKVQNIITNNIYGDNNPLNIAAGQKVIQKDIHNVLTNEKIIQLEKLGVEKNDIANLQEIITSHKDKPTFKEKAMKWLGNVSASIAARGLYENIPAITEFVNNLI